MPRQESPSVKEAASELEELGEQLQDLCGDIAEHVEETGNPPPKEKRRLKANCRRLGSIVKQLDD